MGLASLNLSGGGFLYANDTPFYSFGISDFTVEAWVKTMAGGTIVGKKSTDGGAGNGGFLLVARPDGTIKFATDDGYGFYELDSVPTAVCDGIWHHVAAVRQGATISLYLDGQPIAGTPRGNAAPPLNVSNSLRLTFGTVDQQQETYRNLTGAIAEIRLWNCAKTASEIQDGYSIRLPPGSANLVGYWSIEQGLTADFSQNNNAAQIYGSVIGSTDAPAVGAGNSPTMLFLFSGSYDAAVKWGGASGVWNTVAPLYLTSMGYVVQNNQVMSGVSIVGNAVTWPLQGNSCSGNITFNLNSNNSYFWPESQLKYNFTGSTQSAGQGAVDFRGAILPTRIGCGIFLSVGAGQIFNTPSPTVGSPVTLATKTAQISEHYCIYDSRQILNMASGLALTAQGGLTAGAAIVLAQPDASSTTQQWILGADGTITAAAAPNLAIAVNTSTQPYQLGLANLNASDQNQLFITLSAPQFLFNTNTALVISGSANAQVTVQTKADDAPYELWCVSRGRLLSGAIAQALTVSGAAAPGANLTFGKFNPTDPAQGFDFAQGQLIHTASGLPVKMTGVGAGLVLGVTGETGANLGWTIAATTPSSGAGAGQPAQARSLEVTQAAMASTVDYQIYVYTGNDWVGGTDDKVEIALVGQSQTSAFVELKNSLTHSNPFERGQMDKFVVTLPNMGTISAIKIRYGANNWFYNDDWALDKIYVYDPTTISRYNSGYVADTVGNGSTYWVPSNTEIKLSGPYVVGSIGSTMSVGKAPAQIQYTYGWIDHTWVEVYDPENKSTTYFDCAGTNNGPGTVSNIISSPCSLNTAVKMATGYYIDSTHPYQPVYGHNDVTGQQTCGIRASGFRGWDGQCHQMTNRLLYICNPTVSLDDCPDDKRPESYGLSVMMFGRYGVQFDQWCKLNGFLAPPDRNSSLFDYVRRYISDSTQQIEVAYAAIAMQGAIANDAQNPNGPAAHTFFQAAKNYGVSNSTMALLTCLPEDKVVEEQQPYVPPTPQAAALV